VLDWLSSGSTPDEIIEQIEDALRDPEYGPSIYNIWQVRLTLANRESELFEAALDEALDWYNDVKSANRQSRENGEPERPFSESSMWKKKYRRIEVAIKRNTLSLFDPKLHVQPMVNDNLVPGLLNIEMKILLDELLGRLPDEVRAYVIEVFKGASYKELAEESGRPRSTIHLWVKEALVMMKKIVQDEEISIQAEKDNIVGVLVG